LEALVPGGPEHIGVLKVFEREGLPIQLIAGQQLIVHGRARLQAWLGLARLPCPRGT